MEKLAEIIRNDNEGAAIIGAVLIALVSAFWLGIEAKEIVLGIGMGLIGYISKTP